MDELVSLVTCKRIVFECAHLVFGIKGWIAEDGGELRTDTSMYRANCKRGLALNCSGGRWVCIDTSKRMTIDIDTLTYN